MHILFRYYTLQVPSNFRFVVEQTLREFFKAIQEGRDAEQSWKKSIYKIISRLDDPVPEYFKSPNFLEQLEWPASKNGNALPPITCNHSNSIMNNCNCNCNCNSSVPYRIWWRTKNWKSLDFSFSLLRKNNYHQPAVLNKTIYFIFWNNISVKSTGFSWCGTTKFRI